MRQNKKKSTVSAKEVFQNTLVVISSVGKRHSRDLKDKSNMKLELPLLHSADDRTFRNSEVKLQSLRKSLKGCTEKAR